MEQLSKVLDQAAYKVRSSPLMWVSLFVHMAEAEELFQLIVAQQEAEWLQSERREPTACADVEQDKCDREDQEEASCKSDTAKLRCASKSKKKQKKKASGRVLQPTRATTTTTAPSSPAQAKDCVLEDSDKEEQELRRHLNSFLDHHRFLPASPRFQNQRLLIIEQLFRHLIAFEPVLLVRSQSHDSVHSFLNSESELSMKELRLLAGLLKYAPSGKIDLDLIHQCILAALYGVPPEVKSVKLLGGSVNRKPLSSSLGPEGWCHLYHFVRALSYSYSRAPCHHGLMCSFTTEWMCWMWQARCQFIRRGVLGDARNETTRCFVALDRPFPRHASRPAASGARLGCGGCL